MELLSKEQDVRVCCCARSKMRVCVLRARRRQYERSSVMLRCLPLGLLLLQVGGTPAILKYLLQHNLVDGSCMTVTGRSMADNLAGCPGLKEGQQVGGRAGGAGGAVMMSRAWGRRKWPRGKTEMAITL